MAVMSGKSLSRHIFLTVAFHQQAKIVAIINYYVNLLHPEAWMR